MNSGIYQLTHKETGRIYIGQSKRLGQRFASYKKPLTGKRKLTYVEQAIKKHGWSAFDAKLIIAAEGQEYLDLLEINAIKVFDCVAPKGFNIRTGGNTSTFSAETRKKMSDIRKEYLKCPEVLANLRTHRANQVIPPEAYAKRSLKTAGMKWMNNGVKNCRAYPLDVEEKLKQGFIMGRLTNYVTEEYRNKLSQGAFNQWSKVKA
jgi:group I intron endonuclease